MLQKDHNRPPDKGAEVDEPTWTIEVVNLKMMQQHLHVMRLIMAFGNSSREGW
jgi:hypothetical protein